jgi:hypothetical protein
MCREVISLSIFASSATPSLAKSLAISVLLTQEHGEHHLTIPQHTPDHGFPDKGPGILNTCSCFG